MGTNRNRMTKLFTTAAILATLLLAISGIAAESSEREQRLSAGKKGFLGLDVNRKDENGKTYLMDAAWEGHLDEVKFLIDGAADINAKANKGKTALKFEQESGDEEIVG